MQIRQLVGGYRLEGAARGRPPGFLGGGALPLGHLHRRDQDCGAGFSLRASGSAGERPGRPERRFGAQRIGAWAGDEWPWPAGVVAMIIGDVAAILAYVAAAVVTVWGVAHAVPTGRVLTGFAPISKANRRIVLQEWLAEAFTMWGLAAVVIPVTAAGGADAGPGIWVYRVTAGLLVALGTLTALTGARTPVVWFKICPVLLAGSAALLVAASFL
jgi:hypothetical protein